MVKELEMAATPSDMQALVGAFEAAHPAIARAMADLLLRGRAILDDHGLLDGSVGSAFEAWVISMIEKQGVQSQVFAQSVAALEQLHADIDVLEDSAYDRGSGSR